MSNPEQRLQDLEINISQLEDTLAQLDAVVIRQQVQIDALIRELVTIKQASTDIGLVTPRNLRDELPPHF